MTNLSKICTKRLLNDIKFLEKEPLEYIDAIPDEVNILKWYFLIKGPQSCDYEGGYYLGLILHDHEYPFKAPDFKMLTPSGRFMTDQKICLSNSSYHSNEWSALWNIKTILLGFLSIMMDDKEHGISHINASSEEKKFHSKNSLNFNKQHYLEIVKKFKRFFDANGDLIKLNSNNIHNNEIIEENIKISNPIQIIENNKEENIKNINSIQIIEDIKKISNNKQKKNKQPIDNFDFTKIESFDETEIVEKYKKIIGK
ncbi:Ubiquitin-conjugating enzyme E2 [uncultured virus]|nr:Ubiquitin-conjugating enzyme E2 [uncultured virus]